MLRIIQALNNNVALVKNEKGEQAVVMGLGIVFQKKKGDLIVQDKVEKTFLMTTEESKENFLTLLKNIPLDFLTISYDVIDEILQKYDYAVQEYIYVTLTDHMYFAYQSLKKGSYQMSNLPDMSQAYDLEYKMAQDALILFHQKLGLIFPKDEVGRIALHFINAQGEHRTLGRQEENLTKKVVSLVEAALSANGIKKENGNSNLYDRLMIHFTYLVDRLESNQQDNSSLMHLEEHVKKDYPDAYRIGQEIYTSIEEHLSIELSRSERVYIVLHIQRLLK